MTSAVDVSDLASRHDVLAAEWKKGDLDAVRSSLNSLKQLLTKREFLPTGEGLVGVQQDLLIARDVLEIGAHHAIATKDVAAFERYITQLKTYYSDYSHCLPESAYQRELLGLNLLCLLSKNRIADFHTELEQVPSDTLQNDPYIRCPVRMEQFIMEGSYNKVLMMKDNVPAESYKFFVDELLVTIKDEIASCVEKAYEHIKVKDLAKMLQVDNSATNKYVASRGWVIDKDSLVRFSKTPSDSTQEVPTEELAKMAITYAREMEQIV